MRAIVTGGAGFIGSHICERLLNEGHQVISIDDYSAGKAVNVEHLRDYDCFDEVYCDIANKVKLSKYFKDVDVVFHNAASKKNICLKNPHRDLEVNAGGTLSLLELSEKFGVKKFVHASTGSVYGEPVKFPQDESHPLCPNSFYGVSKLAGERYVNMFALDTTILRYFHVYGARQEDDDNLGGVVSIFIKNALEKRPIKIHGDGEQVRSFTFIDDVVEANMLAWKKVESSKKVYNCASGISVTINELAELVKKYTNSDSEIVHTDSLAGDIKCFDVDNSRIKDLGVKFETDFSKGLRKCLKARS